MAEITLNHPIAEIHGSLSKRSNIVNRQKKYRINGRVIHEGKQYAQFPAFIRAMLYYQLRAQ